MKVSLFSATSRVLMSICQSILTKKSKTRNSRALNYGPKRPRGSSPFLGAAFFHATKYPKSTFPSTQFPPLPHLCQSAFGRLHKRDPHLSGTRWARRGSVEKARFCSRVRLEHQASQFSRSSIIREGISSASNYVAS